MVYWKTIVRKTFIMASFIALAFTMNAQIAVGEWRTHLPYYFAYDVMLSDDLAYCSTTGGLFSYGLEDKSLQKLSKTDGLSDNGVSTMQWSRDDQLAILAYENANLDILIGKDIINIPDIYKKQISGDKSIYHIYYLNGKAYLSCGFGIVVLDLAKYEIVETYYIGDNGDRLKINHITSDGQYLYAATDKGVRRAEIDNPFLIDFNSWELMTDIPGYADPFCSIEFFNNSLFVMHEDPADVKDRLYYYDGSWQEYTSYLDTKCLDMRTSSEYLVLSGSDGVVMLNKDFLIAKEIEDSKPNAAIVDDDGIIWVADYGRGLLKVEGDNLSSFRPNGPFSSLGYEMKSADGYIYSVTGGVTSTYSNLYHSANLQTFSDQLWKYKINYDFGDLLTLAIDPNDSRHVYAASWGYGLAEYKDGLLENIYNEMNSSLQNAVPGGDVVRVGGVVFDDYGNLWMTNAGVLEPISVLKEADGKWKSFRLDGRLSNYSALTDILITEDNHLWGVIPQGNGLFALNTNGTIDDDEDDELKLVSLLDDNGGIITNSIFALTEDLNGNLWVGTNQGVYVLYSPERIFSEGKIVAQAPCIPRDDGSINCDRLLSTLKITCIEVDGGNRKWIGTADGGAYLVSENGLESIYQFNVNNSPLLSNSILDICVDGLTGEVFFGTEKGIVSFRGDATAGANNYNEVKVFPNPVRENYEGPIAIQGLMEESTLKITDVSGNLVMELESFGGEAIWDGRDFKGDRVATGVYLVFMANGDQNMPMAGVTKILFIH